MLLGDSGTGKSHLLHGRGLAACKQGPPGPGTPGGRLLFHVMASLGEFEADLIYERTVAGLAAARARGRKGGRPTVMTPDKVHTARQLYDAGDMTVEAVARTLGVSRGTVYRHLDDTAPPPPPPPLSTPAAH